MKAAVDCGWATMTAECDARPAFALTPWGVSITTQHIAVWFSIEEWRDVLEQAAGQPEHAA